MILKGTLNPASPPVTVPFSTPLYAKLVHSSISSSSFSALFKPIPVRLSSPALTAAAQDHPMSKVIAAPACGHMSVLVWLDPTAAFDPTDYLLLFGVLSSLASWTLHSHNFLLHWFLRIGVIKASS